MNPADSQTFYKLRENADKGRRAANLDYGIKKPFVISKLRGVFIRPCVHHLNNNRRESSRNKLRNFCQRIFIGHNLCQLQKLSKGFNIPFGDGAAFIFKRFQLFHRIVQERAELSLFLLIHSVTENIRYLFTYYTGAVVQNM